MVNFKPLPDNPSFLVGEILETLLSPVLQPVSSIQPTVSSLLLLSILQTVMLPVSSQLLTAALHLNKIMAQLLKELLLKTCFLDQQPLPLRSLLSSTLPAVLQLLLSRPELRVVSSLLLQDNYK